MGGDGTVSAWSFSAGLPQEIVNMAEDGTPGDQERVHIAMPVNAAAVQITSYMDVTSFEAALQTKNLTTENVIKRGMMNGVHLFEVIDRPPLHCVGTMCDSLFINTLMVQNAADGSPFAFASDDTWGRSCALVQKGPEEDVLSFVLTHCGRNGERTFKISPAGEGTQSYYSAEEVLTQAN